MNWLKQTPDLNFQPVTDSSGVVLRETLIVNHIEVSAGDS